MGSLCCVAARPHGSTVASREWSIGRNEPFWRTNSSFSPPLSTRWDYQLSSEGLSYGSHGDGGGPAQYGSSFSSNSKDSRSWRGESIGDHHHFSASEGVVSNVSSPSESLHNHHLMPMHAQGVIADEFVREPSTEPFTFSRIIEGALAISSYAGSTSSHSDGSEYEPTSRPLGSACCSFSNRRSFMSKAIHPLSFPDQTGDNIRREAVQWGSASSIDYTDLSETMESESIGTSSNPLHEGSKCCLCERLLSQRSPWGSRRIVRSGDMPIISVLSCWHVYHAECLERATPKTHKHDPPCPLCEKPDENVSEQWTACRLKAGLSRLKSPGGEGPSKPWSCTQVGDWVEGALHAPKQGKMMLLSRNRLKRQLSLKGTVVKERADSLKRSGENPPEVFHGQIIGGHGSVGRPAMVSSPSLKRW